ncbi:veneno [Cochliomyia hominivorax]
MALNKTFDKSELGNSTSVHVGQVTGFCVLCSQTTTYQCERCGDFYCSDLCQQKDWQSHRYICFPMPKLVKAHQQSISLQKNVVGDDNPELQITSNQSKTLTNTSMPENGSRVVLTAFKSTNRCYIRSANSSVSLEYQKVLKEIHEFGKTSKILNDKPKFALALRGDKWCRVQILNKAKFNNLRICFVDFGDICNRSLKDLRAITPALKKLPCYVHMVQLKGITKYSIETKFLNSLTQYADKEYKVEFVQSDKAGGNVELYDLENNTMLNTLIVSSCNEYNDNESVTSSMLRDNNVQKNGLEKTNVNGNDNKTNNVNDTGSNDKGSISNINLSTKSKVPAVLPRQILMQKPCLVPPFEIIPINESDRNCKVIIMDDSCIRSGYIGCLLEKHLDNLKALTTYLKEYNISDQAYKPKFNEYCLANYEDEWYRAKVVEILSDNKFLVSYIDFTNERELTSKSIRHYPMSLTYPCCTTLCRIDGLPEDMSDELKDYLESNCKVFTSLKIDSVRIVKDVQYVESKELLTKLRNLKLI